MLAESLTAIDELTMQTFLLAPSKFDEVVPAGDSRVSVRA
jgi:hypothetical protein